MRLILLPLFAALLFSVPENRLSADIVTFIATGAAGEGLLQGNIDPATGETGTGGLGATGIFFNTNNRILSIDIEWGSANGFTDMSVDVFKVHLHGPTASSGSDSFGQTAPLLFTLSTSQSFDGSASDGGINDTFLVEPDNVQQLLDGQMYINVHLSNEDTGMVRGYLQAVPEPGSLVVLGTISGLAVLHRRRRRI